MYRRTASLRAGRHGLRIASRRFRSDSARPAIVFDIDGVLKRGKEPIQAGIEALALLKRLEIPFALCTNGGGVPDEVRAKSLTKLLQVEITTRNLCQSHTPFRSLAEQYAYRPILAVGGARDSARHVARSLGFRKAIIPQDLMRWNPSIYPWAKHVEAETEEHDIASLRFAAAFVFHDSLDIGRDAQILCDVLMSTDGDITKPRDTEDASAWKDQLPLYFSNPDLLWQASYPEPRFGQGTFQEAVKAIYGTVTGHDLRYTVAGKPSSFTYDFLRRMIKTHIGAEPTSVTFVGDNPESDIAGANAAGFRSCLVKTGVWRPPHKPRHEPTHIVDNALEAVRWSLEQDGISV